MSRSKVPVFILHPRGAARLRQGFVWLYPQDIVRIPKGAKAGVVALVDGKSNWIGHGLYSPNSKLIVRFLTRSRRPIDKSFFKERIGDAIKFREEILGYKGKSCRLVHGEADYLPGIVIDRIGKGISLQSLTQGADAVLDYLIEIIEEILNPEILIIKNTAKARQNEGLEVYQRVIKGDSTKITYEENGIFFEIDLWEGQKTGVFLDQAQNHALMARVGFGKALDLFSYNGGFGLGMAKNGCEVTCVDASKNAIEALEQSAKLNGIKVNSVVSDVMDFLNNDDSLYDTIVCDPPAFAKKRSHVPKAMKGYTRLAKGVFEHLKIGGISMFCSCSSHVLEEDLLEAIKGGAGGKRFVILAKTGAGADHPVIPHVPQSQYLKCFLIKRLD